VGEGSGIWTPGGERPIGEARQPAAEPREPTPEELIEEIKRLRVSDVLLSTISTVAQLAYVKLDRSSRDLEQARLAIESMRAIVPLLDGFVPAEALRDFQQVVSNLQLAYASAVSEPGEEATEQPAAPEQSTEQPAAPESE
jgi:hypothetical protein